MDRKEAYEFLIFCRDTHQAWIDYFEEYPKEAQKYAETVHDIEGQQKIIDKYNEVLSIMRIDLMKDEIREAGNEDFGSELDKFGKVRND